MNQIPRKILIADDEIAIRRMLTEMLEQEGYEVETTEDGPSTYTRIREGAFDVVLLDVWMSGETGIQALEALEGRDNLPKVIVITSDEAQAKLLEATGKGAYRFLKKPFAKDALLAEIDAALSEE